MNGEERTILAPPDALAWVEADHGAFWAYSRATVLDALERGWTVHRTVVDGRGLRWVPELAGFADIADIANITFRADEHARVLSDHAERLASLETRLSTGRERCGCSASKTAAVRAAT